jgi:hypothetical protein
MLARSLSSKPSGRSTDRFRYSVAVSSVFAEYRWYLRPESGRGRHPEHLSEPGCALRLSAHGLDMRCHSEENARVGHPAGRDRESAAFGAGRYDGKLAVGLVAVDSGR